MYLEFVKNKYNVRNFWFLIFKYYWISKFPFYENNFQRYYYSITQDKYFHFGYYTPFIFWEFIISGPKVYYLLRYKCIINIIICKLHQ